MDYRLRFLKAGEPDVDLDQIVAFCDKNILWVGDFLQLPPVIPNNNSSVYQKINYKMLLVEWCGSIWSLSTNEMCWFSANFYITSLMVNYHKKLRNGTN